MSGLQAGSNLDPQLRRETAPRHEVQVVVTFYLPTGNPMYSGIYPYEGAAACWWGLDIGVRFRLVGDPTGRTYTCLDRGAGPDRQITRPTDTSVLTPWVDVYFEDEAAGMAWLAKVGDQVAILRE
jgi:hypothetical protein